MLLVLSQLNAGGPKVEKLFRKCCKHPEANVRKEALPGLARLIKGEASAMVASALIDPDLEVRKRAAACLAVTGVSSPEIYTQLAKILTQKDCSEEFALQIVSSINRLKPAPPDSPELESALLSLVGGSGFLGIGGRKGSQSGNLRLAVIQALGFVGRNRAQKALKKMSGSQSQVTAKALAEALERLSSRL